VSIVGFPRGRAIDSRTAVPAAGPAWEPAMDFYAASPVPALRETFAHVRCPSGHTLRMTWANHRVAADGTVSPSYVCTATGCTFHAFVKLEGWTPPAAPKPEATP
jgi:hypothetical protein